MPLKQGDWCYRCGAYDYEPAGEKCANPGWHIPDPKVFGASDRYGQSEEVEARSEDR